MLKRSFRFISVLLYATTCLSIVYLLLHPKFLDFILSKPLYGYSILLFLVSFGFVLIIVYKSTFFSPSLFLLIFFMAVPLIGLANIMHYFERHIDFSARDMTSFGFPTFVWSVGTVCFFGGVFLAWLLLPGVKHKYVVLWDHKRMLLLLKISLLLSVLGTIMAIYRIGYIPLLRPGVIDARLKYLEIVGPIVARFSGGFWLIPTLLSSMLFFIEKGKSRYIYFLVIIISALGALLYAQRTDAVLALFVFGLMYFKFSKIKISQFILLAAVSLLLVYVLMIQADYRDGFYSSSRTTMDRITRQAFPEWQPYSIVVDELRSGSKFKGWSIFVGPFFMLVPRQIFTFIGYDKIALMRQYSAVYYYGRKFDNLYGIRIGPIGEAFAAFGFAGVILQMVVLGIFFGAFEKIYMGLKRKDARLCVICYFLSLMLYLPITTVLMLLAPLLQTGVVVFVCHMFGTRKYELSNAQIG